MRSIKDAFAKGKAFIPFITCGDPDLESTKKLVKSMVENGETSTEERVGWGNQKNYKSFTFKI